MAIRLTKKNSVIFAVVIVILCGSLGYLVWRVNQPETTAPTESEAAQPCDPPCGNKPDLANWARKPYNQSMKNISDSSKEDQAKGYSIPSRITIPADVSGEVVLYYKSIDDGLLASFEFNGQAFDVQSLDGDKRAIINTGLHVKGGETFTVNSQVLNGSGSFVSGCEGSDDNKYWSLGWIAPSNGTCGTTFGGPPQGGICTPFVPANVSADISWATSSGNKIVSQQCWGDWMEWVGDYDFNDYLLIVTVKSDASCGDGIVGNTEGEECDPPNDPCTKDGHSGICSSTCKCAVNPYCGDGQLKDDEECEVGDPAGVKCSWTSCNQSACICLPPGLSISKTVVKQCIDEGSENPNSELLYTITVSNTGTGVGQISKIEDTLDTKIITAGIVPTDITGEGSYLEGKITWLFSSPLTISPGETKVYSYKMMIDKSHFGIYTNTVVLTPVSGDPIQATATINADCIITVPTVPQTGVFDSTVGRIAGGFGLIVLGGFVYSMPSRVFLLNGQSDERRKNKYRVKFESKIFKK